MEMIFHRGDLFIQYLKDGSTIIQPRCFVMGQLIQPEIEPMGETDVFSVRFYPDGFTPLAPVDIRETYNKAIALQDLFGNNGHVLEQNVLNAKGVRAKSNA
jgi:hypothetical protein